MKLTMVGSGDMEMVLTPFLYDKPKKRRGRWVLIGTGLTLCSRTMARVFGKEELSPRELVVSTKYKPGYKKLLMRAVKQEPFEEIIRRRGYVNHIVQWRYPDKKRWNGLHWADSWEAIILMKNISPLGDDEQEIYLKWRKTDAKRKAKKAKQSEKERNLAIKV